MTAHSVFPVFPHVTTGQAAPADPASPLRTGDTNAIDASTMVKPPPVAAGPREAPEPQHISAEVSADEVLITEQQVMFSTAAVAASRPQDRRPLLAVLRRVFAALTVESPSRPRHDVPRRMYYFEDALMAREMDRL